MSDAFDQAFDVVVGSEGGFTSDPADAGNWTGGRIGAGRCAGTKYGISAASYPELDIAGLRIEAAKDIYRRDYWNKVRGDLLPPGLALLVFDAAVNNGVGRAIRWLQSAVGVTADGIIGDGTLAGARRVAPETAMAEFQAQRMAFMGGLPSWRVFGLGWARRLCRLPYAALRMGA